MTLLAGSFHRTFFGSTILLTLHFAQSKQLRTLSG
ncbi:Uncharacterised protein [Vibrio cholerae]|nr:Uncharacterised protein [Vibrio cholerae]CSI56789.1 Uncharacterised protein [Vibrio cholerae]